jgi:hypothetical protein
MDQDLMGFLSDFRSAASSKSTPPEPKVRTRRTLPPAFDAATAFDSGPGMDWAPPPTGDIPYYTPDASEAGEALATEPGPAPPESDDYPYYAPPSPVPLTGPGPNWAPPADAPNWAPPTVAAPNWAPPAPEGTFWAPPHANGASPIAPPGYPPAGKRRPPMWVIGSVAAAVAVAAGLGAVLVLKSSPSLNGLTADQVMAKTIAAAHKAGSFHAEATQSQGGDLSHLSIDVGPSSGSVVESSGGHTGTIRVVGGQVYLKGDEPALSQMGFSDSLATEYADQWLTVPSDSPDIQQLVQSLDANQVIDRFLHLSGPLSRISSSRGGGVAIQGTVPDNQFNQGSGGGDSANLVVSNNEPFVPVSISFSDPTSGSTQMTFSRWGEQVALTAPPNAVSLSAGGSG